MKLKGAEGRMVCIDEQIEEAIRHEQEFVTYYANIADDLGPDAGAVMRQLCENHRQHVVLLEKLLDEIRVLRELSLPMAD